ncbi:unnamed protein product [Rotaria sp. Silwood2]|nr:unnamed protein product [Rotaria sp. Silwood2]CAF2600310.1 unnamed protein product [Rotaria sp. Silwood2]CAF2971536.1 unnamed protein product [Rotaria sp. Silwood2]
MDASALLLLKQLRELSRHPVEGISAGLIDESNPYAWNVILVGPSDTFYEGGFFKARLDFPKEYPIKPPKMKFISEIWHPNIEKNGDVCISILHEPGVDQFGYENPSERWSPVQSVGFHNKRNDGVWAEEGEEIEAGLIDVQTDKFQRGVIFWGAISSQGLIPSHGPNNVSDWLEQQRPLNSDRRKRVYLTNQLYEKFLKQKAAPAIKKAFRKPKLDPIFQDDQDRKHRTSLVRNTVAQLFNERIEPADGDTKFADVWRIENIWGVLREKFVATTKHYNGEHKRKKRRPINAPFNIQIPSSLRDAQECTFSIENLACLENGNDARDIALGFLHDHEVFASLWNSDKIRPDTRRLMRKLVQIQTINAVCNAFYRLPDGTKIDLDNNKMVYAAQNTRQYANDHKYDFTLQERSYEELSEILVVDGDCHDMVLCFKNKYPKCNPVVLNMASANNPGGASRNGAGAQEENLHRHTNMFQCLQDPYRELEGHRHWKYPIPEFSGIYSPDVNVFRGSESDGYQFFPDGPKYISFIACASCAHPPIEMQENGEFKLSGNKLIEDTKKKIETIFKIALENKHYIVILSALGCGAFKNPPRHIAQLFKEVISTKYSKSFKYIVFCYN